MKTSEKEYNELLYLISTEENSMSPVPLREDGYPPWNIETAQQ